MSSRLFQEVRERRGLCYAIYSFSSGLSDSGMFAIHAAGGPERAHELFAVIRDELVKAADEGFRDDEVARVKAQLKMGLLAGLESSSARAEQLARQILDPWPPADHRGADREGRAGPGRRPASLGCAHALLRR